MTILASFEAIRTELAAAIPSFIYCDLNEANIEADFKAVNEYPLMILLPFAPVDTPSQSGALRTTANITFFLLGKHEQTTSEHKASEVETAVVAPMRLLARRFVHKLGEHSIIDPMSAGITSVTYNPTYMQLDANLHGVEVVFTMPVMEKASVCAPVSATQQAMNVVFSNIVYIMSGPDIMGIETLTVSWDASPNASYYLLWMSFNDPLTATPTNGETYSAAADGSLFLSDLGVFSLYKGSGLTVDLSLFNPNGTFNFKVFAFIGTEGNEVYATGNSTGNPAALVVGP